MGCGSLATGLAFTLGLYLIFLHRQINYAEGAPSVDRATSNAISGSGSSSESRRGSRSHAGNHLRFAQKLYGGRMRSAPAAVVLAADDFLPEEDDFDVVKKQFDDYGHMRFGKREEFDDYGHMRFGRSGGE